MKSHFYHACFGGKETISKQLYCRFLLNVGVVLLSSKKFLLTFREQIYNAIDTHINISCYDEK